MNRVTYRATVSESRELKGMTGENGERFIVFVLCHQNPLDSAWKWVATRAEAEEIAAKINKDRDDEVKP